VAFIVGVATTIALVAIGTLLLSAATAFVLQVLSDQVADG
jgi:hypothetical protein